MQTVFDKSINIILVGDTFVGKTCLIKSYATQQFPLDYQPTMFDQYKVGQISKQTKDGKKIEITLTLMDPSGLPDHKAIR